eukprot:CAMPEP_0114348680 /NCGR_PEP_ID=MMETSP0101-20121206/14895_1 /TAXON_ID=38822 ORGANISM="Pteridomonas danica, Strain PT" /NCGR_SAMPLE_ID=MMETSP0101 /ASSEMBLY_ACC=CAM_ASM_000211 /LENGTH=490 /DNA_ID=CAMNT_0001486737 /DNA_START=192 /DNA_END=1664 /DNA_ORIENTATION=-
MEHQGVEVTISTEYSHYPLNSASDILVGVNLRAPPTPSNKDRAPVDCVVVSDVSGSMDGPKIDLLRETGKLLLNEFTEKDRVGLVTFDSDAKVQFPIQSITENARLKAIKIVDYFRSGSSTNLSGGLFAGISQLIDDVKANRSHIRTILLMTDGQATHGLKTSSEIVPILIKMLKDTGITLHTFGYGSNHDSSFLRDISNAGKGSYYFVENVDDIRSAFGDCLGGMLSVVAQNLELELEAINGASISKFYHKNAIMIEENKKYRIPFADLYGDEQRDVLLNMALSPKTQEEEEDNTKPSAQILKASLQYIDVIAAKPIRTSASIGVSRVIDMNNHIEKLIQNPKLELQSIRLKVANIIEKARQIAEKGDLKNARSIIEQIQLEIKKFMLKYSNNKEIQEMCLMFELDLKDCMNGLLNVHTFKNMQLKMTSLAEGHLQQRCMESNTVEADGADAGADEGGVGVSTTSSILRSNAYRTEAKKHLASKFSGIF